ncbi:hypothetical protein NRK67_03460 [Fusobacteria bacterium ZRK30]|nr:hypothetical protein NRK67_03460 [Fusobacteria bacterium ZRK30]
MNKQNLIQLEEEVLMELLKKIKNLLDGKLGDNSLRIYQLSQSYNTLKNQSEKES